MGARANLAIGDAADYRLFYSHWCANTLPADLFWGPDHAAAFILAQREVDPADGWLDDVWAEGGAVVDPAARTLLLFGGEDVRWDIPLRRLYLRFLATAWSGWTVRWASEGIVDLAEYLGVPREQVLDRSASDTLSPGTLEPPERREWLGGVATVAAEGVVRVYPLACDSLDALRVGPDVLESAGGLTEVFTLAEWTDDFPAGGFHIDRDRGSVDFWTAGDGADAPRAVGRAWPGWAVTWHEDRYEAHLRLAAPWVVLAPPPAAKLIDTLLAVLDRDSEPVDVAGLVRRLSDQTGSELRVSAAAGRDDRVTFDAAARKRVLALCVAALED